jgi:hypothetical protein
MTDKKSKNKSNDDSKSGFPSGMTDKKSENKSTWNEGKGKSRAAGEDSDCVSSSAVCQH